MGRLPGEFEARLRACRQWLGARSDDIPAVVREFAAWMEQEEAKYRYEFGYWTISAVKVGAGYRGFPRDWDKRSAYIKIMAELECQMPGCGRRSSSAQVRHILPRSAGVDHSLTNLRLVCPRCHDALQGAS
jgi:hypothetical protein